LLDSLKIESIVLRLVVKL